MDLQFFLTQYESILIDLLSLQDQSQLEAFILLVISSDKLVFNYFFPKLVNIPGSSYQL